MRIMAQSAFYFLSKHEPFPSIIVFNQCTYVGYTYFLRMYLRTENSIKMHTVRTHINILYVNKKYITQSTYVCYFVDRYYSKIQGLRTQTTYLYVRSRNLVKKIFCCVLLDDVHTSDYLHAYFHVKDLTRFFIRTYVHM